MLKLPKLALSHPLTKAIQTTEGILVVALDVAVAVTSALDPSSLPHSIAAYVIGAQHLALLAQRGYIKGQAAASIVGIPAPGQVVSQQEQSAITSDATAIAKAGLDVAKHALAATANVTAETVSAPVPVPTGTPTTPAA